jgi:hypothetical protein
MTRIKSGNGHDGISNAFRKAGEPPGLQVHHDPNDARKGDVGVKGNIARDGAPKRMHPVSVHNGMTERQQALKGMQHANATAPDANPASPLSKEPQGKCLTPPAPHPGMKKPTCDLADLGRAVLSEALGDCPQWKA